jgi:hypothetical protein
VKSNLNTPLLTLGFLFFILGFLSLILNLIGINLVFLQWLDFAGHSLGWLFRLIFIIIGIVLIVMFAQPHSINRYKK